MKKITTIFLLLIGSPAFASTIGYDLKVELSMNGKHVSSPRLITREGETASITQESNGKKIFMDVIAMEEPTDNQQGILMSFVVGTISAMGEKKIVSTPKIITLENEEAQITVGQQGQEELSLSIVATRKVL